MIMKIARQNLNLAILQPPKDNEMKRFFCVTLTTLLLALLLSSCSPAAPAATATPVATATLPPSPTPVPFMLTSSAFEAGTAVPVRHACHGENLSPALAWGTPPSGTQSLVLVMDDPDAVPVAGKVWDHWIVYNMPADLLSLPEGVLRETELPGETRQGQNSSSWVGYGGPCPPSGQTHNYVFTLYAVDTLLTLEPAQATKAAVLEAIEGHILDQTELIGSYTSP
jgi:Raf kinase inhibitor-like YbhB/YbcL family protein